MPAFVDGAVVPQDSWDAEAPELMEDLIRATRRIEFLVHECALLGSDLLHCWMDCRIQPLQDHAGRLMSDVTLDKKDSMRLYQVRLPSKE